MTGATLLTCTRPKCGHKLPAEVIGSIKNLRFITIGENCSKQGYNDADEILELYYRMSVELPS